MAKLIIGRGDCRMVLENHLAESFDRAIGLAIPDLIEYLKSESNEAKSRVNRFFPRRTGKALASLEQAIWIGSKFDWIKAGVRTDLQYAYKFRMKGRSRKRKTSAVSTVQRKQPSAWKAVVKKQYRLTTLSNERLKRIIRDRFGGEK